MRRASSGTGRDGAGRGGARPAATAACCQQQRQQQQQQQQRPQRQRQQQQQQQWQTTLSPSTMSRPGAQGLGLSQGLLSREIIIIVPLLLNTITMMVPTNVTHVPIECHNIVQTGNGDDNDDGGNVHVVAKIPYKKLSCE
ncbi:hypothetical protein AWZ03_013653 [Drosophila navojoa]|uniref:Uncharacterized protein n=1 Tax=Drosophila navojoa TaxID=7232 RepID=A0A484ATZ3_DRONA|nr:hypothetical protein AWZ03_013653 [Drosophila navojoa]